MWRLLVLLVLAAAACRPASYGARVDVLMPRSDVVRQGRALPGRPKPLEGHVAVRVDVPAGSTPRVLRPDPRYEVIVPADDEPYPWMPTTDRAFR
jgi:hypothetical protein